MENYRRSLKNAIKDNEAELILPSREYSPEEIVWMNGYIEALQDMLGDFENDYENFLNELITTQLN